MANFSFCASLNKLTEKRSIFFALILGLIFHSCSSSKKTTQAPPPKPEPPVVKEEIKPLPPKEETNKPLNFAMLLPLDLKNQVTSSDDSTNEYTIDAGVLPYLQFLEGALLAADSLKTLGVDLSIKTIDAPADSIAFTNVFYRKDVLQADVIFAAVNSTMAVSAAGLAQKHKHKIVFTQPAPAVVTSQNNYSYLSIPSTTTQCESAADFVLSRFTKAKYFIVTRDVKREKDIAEIFKKKLSTKANFILYTSQLFDSLANSLSRVEQNVILLSSSDQDFVSPLLNKLNGLNMANITIMGLPTWENFETIDYGLLKNLRILYFTSSYTDADNPELRSFRQLFYNRYKTEPIYNAYQGFDLMMYFAKTMQTGKKADSIKISLVPFEFSQGNETAGFENKLIHILEIKDYELIRLN